MISGILTWDYLKESGFGLLLTIFREKQISITCFGLGLVWSHTFTTYVALAIIILFMRDNFENQIIDAIKKIRGLRQRPDADWIFKTITKDAATNTSLVDVQQMVGQMTSSSQLQNKSFQDLDSY